MNTLTGEILTLPKMSGSVSTPNSLSGNVGAKTINIGGKGDDGATFTPSVSADGIISWTNDKDLPNPEPVNIKGVKGDKGDKGDRGLQGIQGIQGERGEKGEKGEKGYTPVKGVDYFDGKDGQNGYTPVKGVDYFDGQNGKDGYTPVKGIDYFDGKDGQSGVYVGSGDMPEDCNVQIDPDSEPYDINAMVSVALNKPWTKLDEITFSEDGTPMNKTYNNLGGMTEFLFKVEGLTNNGLATSGMTVTVNGYYVKGQVIPVTSNANNYCYVELTFNGLYWKHIHTGSSVNVTNWAIGSLQTPYNIEVVDDLTPAETMTISQHSVYYAKAGKLIIYGR